MWGWIWSSWVKSGQKYKRNKIGETGDPCGIPVVIGVMGSDSASKFRLASRSVRKESTHLVITGLRRISFRVCSRRCL